MNARTTIPTTDSLLHGDALDCMTGYTNKAKAKKNRPAVPVIYEPN